MRINKILFITLSNIGDVILTLPALDSLRERFAHSKITVMVGPRPKEIFKDNPHIDRLIIYDKHSRLKEKIKLFNELKKENFDMVADLRNSLFGMFLPARYRTSPLSVIPKEIEHMKDRHLYKIQNLKCSRQSGIPQKAGKIPKEIEPTKDFLNIRTQDKEYINQILKENNITDKDKIVVISPGARSHIKRWSEDKFVELISSVIEEFKVKVILIGDQNDISIAKYITGHSKYPLIDLSGKTTIAQLAYLLKKSALLITNDSAVLHIASYLNTPMVAIFGPTSEIKYGPWSRICAVVKKDIFCRPCERAQCKFRTLECMQLIKAQDVLREVRNILVARHRLHTTDHKDDFKRILIVRTDRIGDVLLSTPVIKVLRDEYPCAFIAVMVCAYAKDIVEGNPYLDEVIIYHKKGRHKSWYRSLKFAHNLKQKRFDLAIILHPTNRVHLITFFAGIPKRIGYNRKFGFLLTDRIKHTKQLGERHELEYNLDLLKHLGIHPTDKLPFMPIRPESERWVEQLFEKEGINKSDRLLAIHPGASCPSKTWPQERFSKVADRLVEKYGFKVLLIAGPRDIVKASLVVKNMNQPVINLVGRTSVSQLASLLKRCRLFISNDSGPVHIASGVGTPVISIFGRNQRGLSPNRWRPLGKKDRVLHKEVGCIECLAHNCIRSFVCLKAITVEDVLNAADSILKT